MTEQISFDWDALDRLIPLCLDFHQQHKKGEAINLHDAACKIGQAFEIDDIDEFTKEKIKEALHDGLNLSFEQDEAQFLMEVFTGASKPVMDLVFDFAHGGKNAEQLLTSLNDFCLGNTEAFTKAFMQKYGIPGEIADPIAKKIGPGVISVYCFAAAFEIYQKAAQDAQLAKERRLEIERMTAEAIEQLQKQREEMASLVDNFLLDRIAPFSEGMHAMDQAVLENDDDGFISANAGLWALFGRKSQYSNASEFEDLMLSDEAFKL